MSIRKFSADERGSVALIAAFAMTMLLALAGIVVDMGNAYVTKRAMQGAADIAAMAGATDPTRARTLVLQSLADNNVPSPANLVVTAGTYTADPNLSREARFVPTAASLANAVAISFNGQATSFMGRVFGNADGYPFTVRAMASRQQAASMTIGSRLASLNGGLLNSMLGSLLGTSVSLSLMDYQALASAKVDLLSFLTALDAGVNLKAASYSDVLAASVGKTDVVRALAAVTGDSTSRIALSTLANAGGNGKITLATLLDLGPYAGLRTGDRPGLGTNIGVLNLLTAVAQASNGQRQVFLDLGASIPGLLKTKVTLQIGERPVSSPLFAIGFEGATVKTAQTRLLVRAEIAGSGLLSAIAVKLPIYVEIAEATASMKQISCGSSPGSSKVTVEATPAVVKAWIGEPSAADMTNFSSSAFVDTTEIARLPLVSVTGRAYAAMTNMSPQSLVFTDSDIRNLTPRTVRTRDFTTSLVTTLLGDLQLKTTLLGFLPIGLDLGAILGEVGNVLRPLTPSLDSLLYGLVSTLGVGLGEADIWVGGVQCDSARLAG